MMTDQAHGLRRCDAFPTADFSISQHQLIAIGQPHRSVREMLEASERPTTEPPARHGAA